MKRILITGGAGFVGSHVARELIQAGYAVRVFDNLTLQVHGSERKRPAYLSPDAEFIYGDVRDVDALDRALNNIDAVFHFAARVGVGQSMYEIADYTSVNNYGTAVLLECLLKNRERIQRLIVASSMSIYGEGQYKDRQGNLRSNCQRSLSQIATGDWDVRDEHGDALIPVPTPETKSPCLISVYALSKFDQERMCMAVGSAYDVPTVALRFFNIFGPHQALSNPYTGVMAIFASRLLNNKPPMINEDGQQLRDFVSVHDIARACRLALESDRAVGQTFNIGSGRPGTIHSLAVCMASFLGKDIAPEVTGKYRAGDIRNCYADITHAQEVLGYEPRVSLKEGMQELAAWLEGQAAEDHTSECIRQLEVRGLMV